MDCSLPDSSVHGDSPGKNIGVGCHAHLQGIFPTQGSNPGLLHCSQILYLLSHQGSPKTMNKLTLFVFKEKKRPSIFCTNSLSIHRQPSANIRLWIHHCLFIILPFTTLPTSIWLPAPSELWTYPHRWQRWHPYCPIQYNFLTLWCTHCLCVIEHWPHFFLKSPLLLWHLWHSLSPNFLLVCVCLVTQLCPTLWDPWTIARQSRLCPWDFPGKSPGVGCHFLLLGIFLTQGSNPHLQHLFTTEPPGEPRQDPRSTSWRSESDTQLSFKSSPFVS